MQVPQAPKNLCKDMNDLRNYRLDDRQIKLKILFRQNLNNYVVFKYIKKNTKV